MKKEGFTLLEVLIVASILVFLVSLILPLSIDFYRGQELKIASRKLVQVLRMAREKSMAVENDAQFGVYMGSGATGEIVLFRGPSYEARDGEEVFEINDNIFLGGISEVIFSKLEGEPSATGVITLILEEKSEEISLNSLGRINLEM